MLSSFLHYSSCPRKTCSSGCSQLFILFLVLLTVCHGSDVTGDCIQLHCRNFSSSPCGHAPFSDMSCSRAFSCFVKFSSAVHDFVQHSHVCLMPSLNRHVTTIPHVCLSVPHALQAGSLLLLFPNLRQVVNHHHPLMSALQSLMRFRPGHP